MSHLTEQTKVLDAFLEAEAVPKENVEKEEREIEPIGYEPRKEPVAKERIGDTSVNRKQPDLSVKGPTIPEHLRKILQEQAAAEEILDKEEVAKDDGGDDRDLSGGGVENPEGGKKKRRRGDRGAGRKRKVSDENPRNS